MEKPNNRWFTPAIATVTAGLTGATLREQQLTRKAAEKSAKTRQPLLDEKRAKRQLKAVLEVRSGIEQGTMSCEEALEYCHRLGINDQKKCLGGNNNGNQKEKIENNKTNDLKKSSKSLKTGDSSKKIPSVESFLCHIPPFEKGKKTNSIFKSNLNTDVLLIENNFQPEDSCLDSNFVANHQAFTADCCDENEYYKPIKTDCNIPITSQNGYDQFSSGIDPSRVSSPLVSVGAPSPEVSPSFFSGSSFAGLLTAAIFLSGYSIMAWLKTKNPTVKKYFTTNEEYFLTSHELLHKKLDTIIENQQKN